ncbi:hypothetical protein [Phytoactinopolyspora endophytica]|uniref:hypothetical protein n=1 Tax=Phytoactinopolyspora endophytica TaxID=1642495 RepID=UPI00101C9880|nr:hypothetical protein [Phytoactinopolyspora endophytica]
MEDHLRSYLHDGNGGGLEKCKKLINGKLNLKIVLNASTPHLGIAARLDELINRLAADTEGVTS